MSNYITLDGIRLDLDSLSESDKQKLRDGLREPKEYGVVTPWKMQRRGEHNVEITDVGGEFFALWVNKGEEGEKTIYCTPTEALQLARALTVAALEKLGVAGPESSRGAAFDDFEEDGGFALSRLDDLIQGAEQGESA